MVDDDESPLIAAAAAGAVSLAAADVIRRGLGVADDAVTETQLRAEAERLIAQASTVTPELLLRLARQSRAELDHAAVERGEKERASMRYVRRFRRDGMSGGSWLLPDEDGGLEIDTALRLLLAARTGGPRFTEVDERLPDAEAAIRDARTIEQVLADGFAQIFHIGIAAEPSIVPGAQRAAVRVVVEHSVLEARRGSALLEDTLTAVTFGKLEEYLCEGGTVAVVVDQHGDIVNFGREQRLFTARQRAALAVRDGGCRFPDCEKPPSWCEAHHVDFWARDRGKTDLENGVLLCRYHHMLMHNASWEILRREGAFWARPPAAIDSEQTLVEMPSRNPIVAGIRQRRMANAC
jgi:hypothetical protein